MSIVGRLAPSPTGAQHLGNARTYLLAWLSIRSRNGRVILRIEDLDSPRIKNWAIRQAVDDLQWLGLDWDEGPDMPGEHGPYLQTERRGLYLPHFQELRDEGFLYPCTCTRSDVANAASAPHLGQDGLVYPGTCRAKRVGGIRDWPHANYCWRFRLSPGEASYEDGFRGSESCQIDTELGDFVVAKADGTPAYQLAVVIDDHLMGVTEVLRGDDLVASTYRQLELYRALGWQPPQYSHVPLVVGSDGRRLAKRHGDTRISVLREAGISPQKLVGWLAWSSGLRPTPDPVSASDLVSNFDLRCVPRVPVVATAEAWQALLRP